MPQAVFTAKQLKPDTLVLGGEIDLSNAESVKDLLDQWLARDLPSYTLDLRPLRIIDSTGLGLVVGAYRRASLLSSPSKPFVVLATGGVLNVIQLIGLDRVLPIRPE